MSTITEVNYPNLETATAEGKQLLQRSSGKQPSKRTSNTRQGHESTRQPAATARNTNPSQYRSVAIPAICFARAIKANSRSLGLRGSLKYMSKVPITFCRDEKIGTDQQALKLLAEAK